MAVNGQILEEQTKYHRFISLCFIYIFLLLTKNTQETFFCFYFSLNGFFVFWVEIII